MPEQSPCGDPDRDRVIERLKGAASGKDEHWQVEDRAFRRIVESALEYGILSTAPDGTIMSWNSGAEALFKRPAQDALGQSMDIIYTPEDRRAFRAEQERREAVANGKASDTRWHQKGDGSRFWASGLCMPMLDEKERLTGFIKIVRDMTAERRLEDSLQVSESRLRLIIDAVPGLIAYFDRELRYVVANRAYDEWLGLRQAQVLGRTASEVLGAEGFGAVSRYMEAALQGHRVTFEAELTFPNGRRWVRGEYIPHRVADGVVAGFVALLIDIAAQKRLEGTLQASKTRLEDLLDAAHDAIFTRDLDSRITFWNAGARELYGYTSEEALGRISHDLLRTRFPEALSGIELAMRTTGRWEGRLAHRRKDGSTVEVDSRWQLPRGSGDEPQAVLEINREVRSPS